MKFEKTLEKILLGRADANISFDDLCLLLEHLGFHRRTKGSHQIFWKEGVNEILNLQPRGRNAKAYQVKQVRNIIVRYRLGVDDE